MDRTRNAGEEYFDNLHKGILSKFEAWKMGRRQEDRGYRIEGFHVIAGDLEKPIYIREFLDFCSYEFSYCVVAAEKRLEIIAELGLESLTATLAECYTMKKHDPICASRDAMFALDSLLGKATPL